MPRARARLALLAALAATSLASAQDAAHSHPAPAGPPPPPEAYALVGDVAILRTAVKATAEREGAPLVVALQRAITSEVLRQNLVRVGADPALVPEAELDQGLAEAKAALSLRGAKPAQLTELDRHREELRVGVAFSRYVGSLVSDADLLAFFEAHELEVAGEVRLRAVVVRVDPARGGGAGAIDRAMQLRARLGDAPTDATFAALARDASEEPSAVLTGGDLDWQSNDQPTVSLSIVRAGLSHGKPGLVPQPIVTPRAVFLVYVTDVRLPETATREALLPVMRARIREKTAAELMDRWLAETPVRLAEDAPHYQRPR